MSLPSVLEAALPLSNDGIKEPLLETPGESVEAISMGDEMLVSCVEHALSTATSHCNPKQIVEMSWHPQAMTEKSRRRR